MSFVMRLRGATLFLLPILLAGGMFAFLSAHSASAATGSLSAQCTSWPSPQINLQYLPPTGTGWTWAYQVGENDSSNRLLCSPDPYFPNGPYGTTCDTGTVWWQWLSSATSNRAAVTIPATQVISGQYYAFRVKENNTSSTTSVSNSVKIHVDACSCGGPCGTPVSTVTPTPTSSPVPPVMSMGATPAVVFAGSGSTITWSSVGASSCVASGGSGSWPGQRLSSGQFKSGALFTTTTFGLTCSGPGGSVTKSVTVSLAPPSPTPLPTPPPPPVTLSPTYQSVAPGVSVMFKANGGDGVYLWTAAGGAVSGSGAEVGIIFPNATTSPIFKTVTVSSAGSIASAVVEVGGLPTFQDSIYYAGEGPRYLAVNNGALYTDTPQVSVNMAHGFAGVEDGAVTVRLSNTLAGLSQAAAVPFQPSIFWNMCSGLGTCGNGLYTVYAIFSAAGQSSAVVMDSITYLSSLPSIPAGWPVWGVRINDDDDATGSTAVQLRLNPWFEGSNTHALISNREDFSDAGLVAFGQVVGWDLCYARPGGCRADSYTVYVQYLSNSGTWPASTSPTYGDVIAWSAASPSPSPSPSPVPTSSVTPTPSLPPSPTPVTSPLQTPGPNNTPPPPPSGEDQGPGSGGSEGAPPGGSSGSTWLPPVIESALKNLSNAQETVITPIAVASMVTAFASTVIVLIPLFSSAGSGMAAFGYQWFMGFLGLLPKRKKVWGTVYDANTKRPIPFAKVQLIDRNRRVLETHIADKDGRYGFLTTPESLMAQHIQIAIMPSQGGYLFPSKTPSSIDTFVYNNLYYGDMIEVNDQMLINFDIPMDPIRASAAPLVLKSPSIALGASVAALADTGFWLGLIMVPLNFALAPNPFTFGTLCLFLGTASLRLFGISEHPYGVVTDASGHPVAFALITLNDVGGQRKAFTVSDERGRYFLVVEKGTYDVQVVTPATVSPMRRTTMTVNAKKGWITMSLHV